MPTHPTASLAPSRSPASQTAKPVTPNNNRARRQGRLCCCALLLALLAPAFLGAEDQPAQPKTKVQIEFWMVELDLAKLRTLDLTCEHLGQDGQLRQAKVIDVLAGKEKDLPILQRPNELLEPLRRAGVARVLSEPTIVTLSGRQAVFEVGGSEGGSKLETTPTVQDDGQIRLDLRAEHNEPFGVDPVTNQPGNNQRVMSFTVALESGKTALVNPFGQGTTIYPNGKPSAPPPIVIGLVRVTLDKPTGEQPKPPAASTSVVDVENHTVSNVKSLTVHLKVVQVNRDKLKKLGFQWSQLKPNGQKDLAVESIDSLIKDGQLSGDQLTGFLKSLEQNGLARVLAEPTLVTLDGRPAELKAGQTSLEFVPILLASGRVKLECRLKTGDSPPSLTAAELDLGKLGLVRNISLPDPRVDRQSAEAETLVFARVDLLKTGEISNIAGPPTYIEVAGRPK